MHKKYRFFVVILFVSILWPGQELKITGLRLNCKKDPKIWKGPLHWCTANNIKDLCKIYKINIQTWCNIFSWWPLIKKNYFAKLKKKIFVFVAGQPDLNICQKYTYTSNTLDKKPLRSMGSEVIFYKIIQKWI